MFCICQPQVGALLGGLTPPEMALTLPEMPSGLPGLPALAGAAASLSMAAELSLSGTLEMMLELDLTPPPLEVVLGLEEMAAVEGGLGLSLTAPSAQMDLSLAAGSLNLAAPSLSALGMALGPAMEPFGELSIPLSISAAIEAALGINMGVPGAGAELAAALSAALEMSGSLPELPTLPELSLAARAINAAIALGMEPGAIPEFAATLEATLALEVPPLELTPPEMGAISAGLMDMGLLGGLPELTPPAIEATMEIMMGEMGAALEATADIAADLSATPPMPSLPPIPEIPAVAMPELPTLGAGGLPSMGDLPLAASMAATFEGAAGVPMISDVPCPNIFCVA